MTVLKITIFLRILEFIRRVLRLLNSLVFWITLINKIRMKKMFLLEYTLKIKTNLNNQLIYTLIISTLKILLKKFRLVKIFF